MDSKQLEFFEVIAETENITKAADKLFISKQALSKSLQNLENELGCLLFNRIDNRIYLNEKGRNLLLYAKKIKALMS